MAEPPNVSGSILPFQDEKEAAVYLGVLQCLRNIIPNLVESATDNECLRGSFGARRTLNPGSSGPDGVQLETTQLLQVNRLRIAEETGAGCIKVERTLALYVGRSLYFGRHYSRRTLDVRPTLEWVAPGMITHTITLVSTTVLPGHLPIRGFKPELRRTFVTPWCNRSKMTPDLTSDVSVKSRAYGFYATGPWAGGGWIADDVRRGETFPSRLWLQCICKSFISNSEHPCVSVRTRSKSSTIASMNVSRFLGFSLKSQGFGEQRTGESRKKRRNWAILISIHVQESQ